MATDLLTSAVAASEAPPMPHRLLYIPIAPIFGVFGAALTGVCTLVGSTVQHGQALLATTAESPISSGWWGGLLMAIGAAVVSVYEGLRQKKRAQDTEDRAAWRAELMQADEERVELRAEVKRLNAKLVEVLGEIQHVNSNVKNVNSIGGAVAKAIANDVKSTIEEVGEVAKSTNRKVTRVAESLSGSGLNLTGTDTDMPTVTPPPAKMPPEVIQ